MNIENFTVNATFQKDKNGISIENSKRLQTQPALSVKNNEGVMFIQKNALSQVMITQQQAEN